MTLWALRVVILGLGPWKLIHSEEALDRLRHSPRQRRRANLSELGLF